MKFNKCVHLHLRNRYLKHLLYKEKMLLKGARCSYDTGTRKSMRGGARLFRRRVCVIILFYRGTLDRYFPIHRPYFMCFFFIFIFGLRLYLVHVRR